MTAGPLIDPVPGPPHVHRYYMFGEPNGGRTIILALVDSDGMIYRAGPIGRRVVDLSTDDVWIADEAPA